jgi:L-lactate dehydrogenase complex protein LldG
VADRSDPARAAILGRISSALTGHTTAPPIPRDYGHSAELGDLTELAAERIADYRATVRRVAAGGLGERIAETLAGRGKRTIVLPPGLPTAWYTAEVTWWQDDPANPLSIAELDGSDGVLTGCALAIAETGTIVLDGGAGQGRRMLTLLPDYHLCVLRADQIVGTVPDAVARLDSTRPITFISGPSATSDIEFNRVEGVHGPRTLDVLIVG